jgi:DNA-3-methyladenine glycosylase II
MSEDAAPDESLRPALDALAERDADIASAYEACGLPKQRRRSPDFAGLVRTVAAQQVSNSAAAAIIGRLEAALPDLRPETAAAIDLDTAREIGLSRQKLTYIQGIARAVLDGRLNFARLAEADDDTVMAELTALKGVGRWTAEAFLLFGLQRPDVFPAQDLALQVAAKRLKQLPERPTAPALREIAEAWRPYRSAAARFLWHYYRHPGVPEG